MNYMEIVLLTQNSIRIKDKQASFVVDPQEKVSADAYLLLKNPAHVVKAEEETVIISGPGEYEIGGVKLSGIRAETNSVYSLNVGGVAVLVGDIK